MSAKQTNRIVTLIHVLLKIDVFLHFLGVFFGLPSCGGGIFSAWCPTNIVCFGLLVEQSHLTMEPPILGQTDSLAKPSTAKRPGRNPPKYLSRPSQVSRWPPLSLACLHFLGCIAYGAVHTQIAKSAGPLRKKRKKMEPHIPGESWLVGQRTQFPLYCIVL